MTLSITPLSPNLGVEISGINPANLSASDRSEVMRLFEKHHFLLLRNVDRDEEAQLGFVRDIGPLSTADAIMKDGRKFTHISNVHQDGRLPEGELLYHSDHMFLDTPLKAISLYAIEAPRIGGETRFLNAAATYEALPEFLKDRIEGLSARHVYDYDANRGSEQAAADTLGANSDEAVHPLVWRHPDTGLPILFVSRLFTVEILGVSKADSDGILKALFDHIDGFGDDYVHAWQEGDLIVWDNRVLQHARNDFPPTERRALRRVPIGEIQPD